MANGTSFCVKKCHQLIIFCENSEICQNYHHSRSNITFWEFSSFSSSSSLLTGLLVEMVARRTLRRSSRKVIRDQGELLLQVGQPAGLAAIFNFIQPVGRDSSLIVLQDKDEALPTGWIKKRQFRSTLSEGVELMTGLDWYNVAPIFLWEKNVTNFSDYFSENSEICQNYRHSRWLKWNEKASKSRSRMKSEMKLPRDWDWEVKFLENSREILENQEIEKF